MVIISECLMNTHNVWMINLAHERDLIQWVLIPRHLLLSFILLHVRLFILLYFFFFFLGIFVFEVLLSFNNFNSTMRASLSLNTVPHLSKCPYINMLKFALTIIQRRGICKSTYRLRAFWTFYNN